MVDFSTEPGGMIFHSWNYSSMLKEWGVCGFCSHTFSVAEDIEY